MDEVKEMEDKEQPRVAVAIPVPEVKGSGVKTSFQSLDAEKAFYSPPPESEPPVSAEMSSPQVKVATEVEDPNQIVSIVPRKTVARTRIGPKWYTFQEGKKALVPRHVAALLAERGVV
jgi:hypothetical protein